MTDLNLETMVLTEGAHAQRTQGLCAMEAVAWLAGEAHSDAPACACPVLTSYVQRLNDALWLSDATRTDALRPWLARIVGSRGDRATEIARAQWLTHRVWTWWAPLAGMAAVLHLEARGDDCTAMRAAYLALLTNPCRATAREAAASAPYFDDDLPVIVYAAAFACAADERDADVVAADVADAHLADARALCLRAAVEDLGVLLAIGEGTGRAGDLP